MWLRFLDAYCESISGLFFEDPRNMELLSTQLRASWHHFQKLPINGPHLFIDHATGKKSVIITIIQPDQPFLVETLKTHLNAYGMKKGAIFHPIFLAKREMGRLIDFSSVHNKVEQGYSFESVISFELKEFSDKLLFEKFQEELLWRFNMLQISIADWPRMRNKIQHSLPRYHTDWDYFDWLFQENFVFVGVREINYTKKGKHGHTEVIEGSTLGLFKDPFYASHKIFEHAGLFENKGEKHTLQFGVRKTSVRSPINRSARLDMIELHAHGHIYQIIGIFTRRSYNTSIFNIPIMKEKAERIFDCFGLHRSWHGGKMMLQALEAIPHDEYWHLTDQEIITLCRKILGFHEKSFPIFATHTMDEGNNQTVMIFLGRDRYSLALKQNLATTLARALDAQVSSTRGIVDEAPFARLIYVFDHIKSPLTVASMGEILWESCLTWEEKRLALVRQAEQRESLSSTVQSLENNISQEFSGEFFTQNYQHNFSPETGLRDGHMMTYLTEECPFDVMIENKNLSKKGKQGDKHNGQEIALRIMSKAHPLGLTYLLEVLNHFGILVDQETTYPLGENLLDEKSGYLNGGSESRKNVFYLHYCVGTMSHGDGHGTHLKYLGDVIKQTLGGYHPSDLLNRLFVACNLDTHQIHFFRSIFSYLQQHQLHYTKGFVAHTLERHTTATLLLLHLFEEKFDAHLSNTKRTKSMEDYRKDFADYVEKVEDAGQDEVLRRMEEIILAMVRTNYYEKKEYLSFKINCSELSFMQQPKPMIEAFVCGFDIEGIHLRTSYVARGGIRHSDRPRDYRGEVLQLMQAQDLKNSLIVPTGAKGGFVVKLKNATKADIVRCYETFISGLLDLVDNIQDEKIVHKKNQVIYDQDDTYFVVAADKGTATFSDIANTIAQKYEFWLGDAFASGGSNGYDHKKLGITARGAFVSVRHHLEALNINLETTPISVIGVGDMSGDVFGNGMLMHTNLKLLGAFNHHYIFLDPHPNLSKSYAERTRLFNLPFSDWKEYDSSILSAGGAIFNRKDKWLYVSPQVQELWNVPEKIAPAALIKVMLGSDVDLLWFGGIGTYICGSEEPYTGDPANDGIRVNAAHVQAKVVGEGANLGVTPLARIELGQHGVHLNSDAIDNAGGVNCSDHEVNLKVLVGTKSTPARDALLHQFTEHVVNHVLAANKDQNAALDLMEKTVIEDHERYITLLEYLEQEGRLKRKSVFFESSQNLREKRIHLTRSELSIILSIGKNHLKALIYKNFDTFSTYTLPFVEAYFPKEFVGKNQYPAHPLYKKIAALAMTENAMNKRGPLYFFDSPDESIQKSIDFFEIFLKK